MSSYKEAGVDIKKADAVVSYLKPLAKKTYTKDVSGHLGGYGALYHLDIKKYSDPVIVTTTDGVGTKLKIAFLAHEHSSVGIDLVAMCVNDLLCCGAEPKLFLDYYATGTLHEKTSRDILKGIVKGCEMAECSLVGGETAEMPGFYQKGEYDLAGFAVGVANKKDIFNPNTVCKDDVLIALSSNGLHSNGFSLVRKIIFQDLKMNINDPFHFENLSTVKEELLKPTRIYVSLFKILREKFKLKGAAHITGGGITENLPRIFPKNLQAHVDLSSWKIPSIFRFLQEKGKISHKEMLKTFNCGVGMVLIISPKEAPKVLSYLKEKKELAWVIGKVIDS
ncbi:MAG: phosphoribosylformylglycinamidine cyclo-ligase [Deltaproteobacteria bacterium]|nr:phosphoribosylformylglycinamidine cyclo-ligase [Deltaproteobacteria bacterium]